MSYANRKDGARPCGCRPMGLHRKDCPLMLRDDEARAEFARMDLSGVCEPCRAAIEAAMRSGPPHAFTTNHENDATGARCSDALRNNSRIAPLSNDQRT